MSPLVTLVTLVAVGLTYNGADGQCATVNDPCYQNSPRAISSWVIPQQRTQVFRRQTRQYNVRFSCRGRVNGLYADLDHGCVMYHYCSTSREQTRSGSTLWTYGQKSQLCQPGTRFDQQLRSCVAEERAMARCEESEVYYPVAPVEPVALPVTEKLLPVKCPLLEAGRCNIREEMIELKHCPEPPGTVRNFPKSGIVGAPAGSTLVNQPSINQGIGQPGLQDSIVSNPRINQNLGQPGLGGSIVSNPRINQNLGQPGLDSSLASNPRINQNLGQPGLDGSVVSNPRIDQTIGGGPGGSSLSHQPSISQTIGGAGRGTVRSPNSPPLSGAAAADYLGLPLGSQQIVGDNIDISFDCTGKLYGYYADVNNQCKVYHVCSPKKDEYGVQFYEHYSFLCNPGTQFDQRRLTCVQLNEVTTPCRDSIRYYDQTAVRFAPPTVDAALSPKPLTGSSGTVPVKPLRRTLPSGGSPWYEPSSGPSIGHQPSIGQDISQPGFGSSVASNPRVDQSIGSGGQDQGIYHQPSVSQSIGGVGGGGRRLVHNPRIGQSLGSSNGGSSLVHNPSVSQTIGLPGGSGYQRSHPSIDQGLGQGYNQDSVVHRPSISQTIVRSLYDRPARRMTGQVV